MKYRTLRLGTLSMTVALAGGFATAQQESDPEGVRVPQRIEATSPPSPETETETEADQRSADRTQDERALEPGIESQSVVRSRALQENEPGAASTADMSRLDRLLDEHENLGKFVEAVEAAGLAESLSGDTAYTVFAPTDQAWESVTEDWMAPANRAHLLETLRSHIVTGDLDQEMVEDLGSVQTVQGGTLQITADENRLMVEDARVVETDIRAGNMRIHAIDKVLAGTAEVSALD